MAKVKKGNIVLTNQQSLIIDGETVVSKERKGQFSSIALDSTSDLYITGFSTDGTLSTNSDSSIPTEKAVKTYVDNNSGDVRLQGIPAVGQMAVWTNENTIEGQ